jgi:translation initiation factor IF-1
MVKNLKGGKHKGQARKHAVTRVANKTRLSEDEFEVYAFVSAISGGSNCRVICQDGKERLCVIRGKFRGGRGKRDNLVTRGAWVLIGMRDWSSATTGKGLETCDLLEVYKDSDKQKLKSTPGTHWNDFLANDMASRNTGDVSLDEEHLGFQFSNGTDEVEYDNLMKSVTENSNTKIAMEVTPGDDDDDDDVVVDVDDI